MAQFRAFLEEEGLPPNDDRIEFSVENYKSFLDRATISMVAAKIKSEDPTLDDDAVIPISDTG